MIRTIRSDDAQIQRTYLLLTFLGMLLHIAQTIIFFILAFPIPAVYNCMSVVFYALMMYFIRRSMYRLTVCAIHIETCLFASCCVLSSGWETGGALFLLAMSSLVYICPFNNKIVPYLFSLAELVVFLVLRVYSYYHEPLYGYLPAFTRMIYYIFNTLACFYIILFAAFSSNISAMVTNNRLRSENKNLSAIANSDFLTTLPSRRAFMQQVKALSPTTPVIAAMGDLDNFKNINDQFGHASGDLVLKTVGHLINSVSHPHAISCRWGGEEFVILFHDCSADEAFHCLEDLRKQIASYHFQHDGHDMNITITFGAYPGTLQEDIDTLIAEADKYLYQGKQSGKNCVIFCNPSE